MVFVLTQQRTLQTPALPPKLKRVKGTERRGETKSARSKILSEFKSKQCLWCHPVETDGEEPWEPQGLKGNVSGTRARRQVSTATGKRRRLLEVPTPPTHTIQRPHPLQPHPTPSSADKHMWADNMTLPAKRGRTRSLWSPNILHSDSWRRQIRLPYTRTHARTQPSAIPSLIIPTPPRSTLTCRCFPPPHLSESFPQTPMLTRCSGKADPERWRGLTTKSQCKSEADAANAGTAARRASSCKLSAHYSAAGSHYHNVCNPHDSGALTQPRHLLWI